MTEGRTMTTVLDILDLAGQFGGVQPVGLGFVESVAALITRGQHGQPIKSIRLDPVLLHIRLRQRGIGRAGDQVAEAAATLRHFWPMHDWLYENQEAWSAYGAEGLEAGLRALGIDESAVARAIRDKSIDARIRADFMGGVRSGVNGTPGFFLNGYRHDGDFRSLEDAVAGLVYGS